MHTLEMTRNKVDWEWKLRSDGRKITYCYSEDFVYPSTEEKVQINNLNTETDMNEEKRLKGKAKAKELKGEENKCRQTFQVVLRIKLTLTRRVRN